MKKTIMIMLAIVMAVSLYAQSAEAPTSGDGTAGNPYQIATWENLYWIRLNSSEWNKYFIQTADITFPPEITSWDNNRGWNPIGDDWGTFGGTYDGNNKAIYGLYINRPNNDHNGLFGRTWYAEIKDLSVLDISVNGNLTTGALVGGNDHTNITNCHSSGELTGGDFTGGLLGTNTGGSIIENCHSSVNVTSENSMGSIAGGFVGHNGDAIIKNCNSTGNVTADIMAGGFVGANSGNSLIVGCYCSGNVNGDMEIGGFVGTNSHSSTIENCCTTSDIYAEDAIGGFAGHNSEATITNCYCRGNVTCETNYPIRAGAGFIGYMDKANISNCFSTDSVYFTDISDPSDKAFCGGFITDAEVDCEMSGNFWDIDSSGQDSTIGYAVGLHTDEMKAISTFQNADWDFYSIWGLCDTINNGYPHLYWQSPIPRIKINSIANTAVGTANITGDLIHTGNPAAYQYGFCWNTEGDLTVKDEHIELGEADSTGTFQTMLSGLIPGTYYHIRAYIISDLGVTYSKVLNFRSYQLPVADHITIRSIDSTTCAIQAEATLIGYPKPSMHGFCWSTESDPSLSDSKRKLGILDSAGVFAANIRNLTPGTNYYIRAYITNAAGTVYSDVIPFTITETGISDNIPATFALDQNYPNPFNPSTTINYQLPENSDIEVSIHNVSGKKIRTLVDGYQDAGFYHIDWNASENPSGIYLVRLHAGDYIDTKKMVFMK